MTTSKVGFLIKEQVKIVPQLKILRVPAHTKWFTKRICDYSVSCNISLQCKRIFDYASIYGHWPRTTKSGPKKLKVHQGLSDVRIRFLKQQ